VPASAEGRIEIQRLNLVVEFLVFNWIAQVDYKVFHPKEKNLNIVMSAGPCRSLVSTKERNQMATSFD